MENTDLYLVYKLINNANFPHQVWQKNGLTIVKPVLRNLGFAAQYRPFAAWCIYHFGRVFINDRFMMVACFKDGRMVHRTCVFPGFYKFPFMDKNDLQLGDIWTREDHRGKGLASRAIGYVLSLSDFKDTIFWYVVEPGNTESIRLAEKHGFAVSCSAEKKKRLGLSFLGWYDVSPLSAGTSQTTHARHDYQQYETRIHSSSNNSKQGVK